MALRASRRCVSAVVVVVIIVVVVAAVAAVVPGAAASLAVAAASLFASLHGGFEELVGVSSCRRVVAGRRADLFGGVGSFPREGVVFATLQFLLEQELEVFLSFSHGLVFLGDDPEVELLCIPVQRSQRFIRCYRVPLRCRLPTLWDRVDGGGREGRRGRRRRGRRRGISEGV